MIVTDVRIGFSEIGLQRYDRANRKKEKIIYTAENFDFYQVYTRDSFSLGKWEHFKPN